MKRNEKWKDFFRLVRVYLLIFLASNFMVPLVFAVLFGFDSVSKSSLYISTINQILVIAGIGYFSYEKKNEIIIERVFAWNNSLLEKVIGLIYGVLIFYMIKIISDGLQWIGIGITGSLDWVPYGNSSLEWKDFFIALILLAVVPALCEELFYRVVAYQYLKDFCFFNVVLISSLLFGMAHIFSGVFSVMRAMVLGCILMGIYCKRQKYWEVVSFHFLYNMLELLHTSQIKLPTDCSYIVTRANSMAECIFWGLIYLCIGIGIIILAIAIYGCIKVLDRKKQKNMSI